MVRTAQAAGVRREPCCIAGLRLDVADRAAFVVYRLWGAWRWCHRDDENPRKGRGATVQKCDDLVERRLDEITVEEGGTDDGGEIEQNELSGYDNLCMCM